MSTDLDAWLYGTHVAQIAGTSARPDLTWTGAALQRWGHGSAVVSGLLPLSARGPEPAAVRAWLRGLLPEGRARLRLAMRADVEPDDVLGFLGAYGRDTAGALVLVPAGTDPAQPDTAPEELTHEEIGHLLDQAAETGAADQLTSLGGLETKVALTRIPPGWGSPTPRFPSTHIVKLSRPPQSRSADLIDTECAALDLARRCGVGAGEAWLADFAGRRAIVVRRYDRLTGSDGTISRIHQEDTAQLLGLDTTDPERKFQYGRALPSLGAIAERLDRMGVELADLAALTTFTVAIGDTDAHAKNISVVHDPNGTHRLAPAYDVAFHTHHGHAEQRFAMDVAGRRGTAEVTGSDLVTEAMSWGLSRRRAHRAVEATLERLATCLNEIDRDAHPGVGESAWVSVEQRVARLRDDLV